MSTGLPELVADLERRVSDLSVEVRYLKGKLDSLESGHGAVQVSADPAVSERVLALTRSLFGEGVQLAETEDPEIPGRNYAVLYVTTDLADDEIMRRENEWYRLVRETASGMHGHFTICVEARSEEAPWESSSGLRREASRWTEGIDER